MSRRLYTAVLALAISFAVHVIVDIRSVNTDLAARLGKKPAQEFAHHMEHLEDERIDGASREVASDRADSRDSARTKQLPSPQRLMDKCFYVEGICHSSRRWFYRQDGGGSHKQPPLTVKERVPGLNLPGTMVRPGYPQEIETLLPTNETESLPKQLNCIRSAIPNHVSREQKAEAPRSNAVKRLSAATLFSHTPHSFPQVVAFAWYNHMLGEFYDRSLKGLYKILLQDENEVGAINASSLSSTPNRFSLLQDLQLYIHLHYPQQQQHLLDSHSLFTSIFRGHPLQDFRVLFDEIQCRCLDRLFFCGYNIEEHTLISSPEEQSLTVPYNRTILVPGQATLMKDGVGVPAGAVFVGMRNLLRQRMVESNPYVLQDVASFRRELVRKHNVPSEWHHTNVTIVGLTKRVKRRRWRNLDDLIDRLGGSLLEQRVLLIPISVEDSGSNSYNQLIRHAALDGLIGIHGAQLTEAIWMKPNSLVVELLAYIPDDPLVPGSWTKQTHAPTPLGVIFSETDLNHVGFPLGRESAPYCLNNSRMMCWRTNGWDDRDYLVDEGVLQDIIDKFVVSKPELCTDFRSQAEEKYVLYNVNCKEDPTDSGRQPHHYYWLDPTKKTRKRRVS